MERGKEERKEKIGIKKKNTEFLLFLMNMRVLLLFYKMKKVIGILN